MGAETLAPSSKAEREDPLRGVLGQLGRKWESDDPRPKLDDMDADTIADPEFSVEDVATKIKGMSSECIQYAIDVLDAKIELDTAAGAYNMKLELMKAELAGRSPHVE